MQWVALANTADSQYASLKSSMLFYSLYPILRAGGVKTAAMTDKRADRRLIEAN